MNNFSSLPNGMSIFPNVFGGIIFALVIGTFLFVIIKGLSTWTMNNNAEIIKKRCKVVDKRIKVWGGYGDSSASTNYYITFEFDDKTRIELSVEENQYGITVNGDMGDLTYQGTRFRGFERLVRKNGRWEDSM